MSTLPALSGRRIRSVAMVLTFEDEHVLTVDPAVATPQEWADWFHLTFLTRMGPGGTT